jgi:uncharacterized protein with FMN-binding domain
MRRALTTFLTAGVLAVPVANGAAAVRSSTATKPKKKVVVITRKFVGDLAQADRWGNVQVTIFVKKTTTTIGKKKTVKRHMTGLSATYPDHTDRSIMINQQAIPILRSEALQAQSTRINMVSGATDTSYAFASSLQGAIIKARKA